MAENKPSYYAIIPAVVRYSSKLTPNAKLLYGEITSLANEKGFCWAGNDYFSKLYNVSNETISRWISSLKNEGFINVEILKNDGFKRLITIDEIIKTIDNFVKTPCENNQDPLTILSRPIDEIVKHNNKTNNIINSNNIYGGVDEKINTNDLETEETFPKKVAPKKGFSIPTIEEIQEYCFERNNTVDANKFFDHYESNGWMVGKTKMKDWKAAIRTWEKNTFNNQNQNQNGQQQERYAGRQSLETVLSNAEHAQRSAEHYRKQMLGDSD